VVENMVFNLSAIRVYTITGKIHKCGEHTRTKENQVTILYNKKLRKLYSSLNKVGVVILDWVKRMREMGNSYKNSVGNLKRRNYSEDNGVQYLISPCSDRL
jgi:hypothetical protein